MKVLLDSLFEFLPFAYTLTTFDFDEYKSLRPPHIMHQPQVNSYFGLTTVKMPVTLLLMRRNETNVSTKLRFPEVSVRQRSSLGT